MLHENKRNIQYFENPSMRDLYKDMENWQNENHKRFLSTDIQKDGDMFCCIALTNPGEVYITDPRDGSYAQLYYGSLCVRDTK